MMCLVMVNAFIFHLLQCYESTSLCLQGPVIEMVGIQTLVQIANDLVLVCNVGSDRITVHGYWKSVELFRSEVNSLFQSFAGQTFTRQTSTTYQPSGVRSITSTTMPKHSISAHLLAKTTASQNVVSSTTSTVTTSIDRLFTTTKVTYTPTTFSGLTSAITTTSVQTRIGLDNPVIGKGRSLVGGVQVLPLELELVRVTPEVSSTPASTITATSSVTRTSLSSAGIFLTTTSSRMPLTTTTSSGMAPLLSQTGISLANQQNSLETSHSDLLKSPVEVKSKVDTIQLSTGQVVTLKQGDIVKEAVDVIVNPANSFLKHEGGVAKAIDSASDGLVQLFSDELVARDGVVPVGGAKYTQAGGHLKCKYVIHTVGPDARKHNEKECETLLKLACENSLTLAQALKATSIAFPAISSGIFSVDTPTVARIIIKTLLEHKYTPPCCLKDIQIVINDQGIFDAFKSYFAKKRKSLGKSKTRLKSHPMVADHTVTAAAHASAAASSVTTTIPSYTFPTRTHHRSGSLGSLDYMKKTKTSTGFHDQLM